MWASPMFSPGRVLATALLVVACAGCKGAVSFKLETPSATVDAGATGTSTGTEANRPAVRIVRDGDRLVYENGEIEFETGSADLKGESTTEVLDQLAGALRRYPALVIKIEGHTDSRGSRDSNQRLSEARARAIEAALVKRGVGVDRLSTIGLGESKPARPEPQACHNKPEEKVAKDRVADCLEIWAFNRRSAFVVKEGSESLPTEGSEVSPPPVVAAAVAPVVKAKQLRRPDWALRFFGGYSLAIPVPTFHGGHFGVGLHASQRFGKRERGYIGGGPRLHYRGLRHVESDEAAGTATEVIAHQFGPEGNLLIGGGSKKVVALFSLRVGLGLSAVKGKSIDDAGVVSSVDVKKLGGWALGGVMVLGKLSPRWSLGGHVEAGVIGIPNLGPLLEVGLNVAWHFGRGRRDGI